MRRLLTWVPVLLIPALLASLALSQAGLRAEWVSTGGPVGGLGYDVRIHPATKSKMFVTDNNAGVALSTDSGKSWKPSNTGITVKGGPTGDACTIFSLTIDPNSPAIVWAGTNGDNNAFGVFKSIDGGATWTIKNTGITDAGFGIVFRGFTIQPGDSNVVYAQAELPTAAHGREFNMVQGRVYKTTDGGGSWSIIWSGNNLARYVIIDPSDSSSNTLYLSTGIFDREAYNSSCGTLGTPGSDGRYPGAGGVGVLKSADGGAHWAPVNTGLTDLYVGSLRMHPANSQVLFAATGNNACSGQAEGDVVSGLFKTSNGGTSWSKTTLPLPVWATGEIMTAVAFSPSNPSIVYAGSATAFFRSADGGTIWARYSKPSNLEWGPPGVRAGVPIDVVVDPSDPNLVYANNYGGGVFRSTDGAQTWAVWSQGYSGADVHAAAIPDAATASVFAIGRSGPFRSPNYGVDWIGIGNGAAVYAEWYSVALQPGNPNVVLIADEHQGVILRSTDSGGDFSEIFRHPGANASDPTKREGFKALVFAPSDPSIVYAGLAKDRGTIDTMTPFTGTGHALYKSANGGATFTSPTADLDAVNVYRLLVDRTDGSKVWAATSGGLYKSINGGAAWTALPAFGTRVIAALAIDPTDANKIIASEKNVGIWISADGGNTLVPGGPFNAGFTNPNPAVLALAFDPAGNNTLYGADFYSGVYRSSDGGHSWSGYPDAGMTGLAVRAVKDLALAGGVLYATTQGGGVFRLGGPAVIPSPVKNDFPAVIVGSSSARSFTIHNTGTAAQTITGKTVGGAQAGDFKIQNDTCSGSVAGSSLCSFDVVFSPSASGARAANVTITSSDPQPYSIALTGTGTPGVSISPGTATVAPLGSQTFTASGGSGSGYAWSLATNNSGGSINASTGAYTAGAMGSVSDVVQATDSLSDSATATITVTAAPGGGGTAPKSSGCGQGPAGAMSLLWLALAVLLRRSGSSKAAIA